MAKIIEMKEIPLEDLELGKGQSRTRDVGKGIDELADSIRKMEQLEPIVVCPGSKSGKYEVLTGQRRFLACKDIGRPTIWAAIMDQRVDEFTAKVISATENLLRRDLNNPDKIDVCTFLFKRYGSIKTVCEETGLPYRDVSKYVKYDRLLPELKDLVDKGEVDVKVAVRAQDAAERGGKMIRSQAVYLAKEMSKMSGVQQKKVGEEVQKQPEAGVLDVIEAVKTGAKFTQITVTLTTTVHNSLQTYASAEGTSQDDAAASLIEEGLSTKGYVEE